MVTKAQVITYIWILMVLVQKSNLLRLKTQVVNGLTLVFVISVMQLLDTKKVNSGGMLDGGRYSLLLIKKKIGYISIIMYYR